jgi:hypothetical protein
MLELVARENMLEFVARENIKLFEHHLSTTTDEAERVILVKMLWEEQGKLEAAKQRLASPANEWPVSIVLR